MQQLAESQRTEPRRVRESTGGVADGARIEMVVVNVREQDNGEWRERVEIEVRRHQAARTEPLQRRRTFAPHRIGKDVHWPELQQCGRMADPGEGSISVFC